MVGRSVSFCLIVLSLWVRVVRRVVVVVKRSVQSWPTGKEDGMIQSVSMRCLIYMHALLLLPSLFETLHFDILL